jgi:DMSO reductase anchor subunit
VKPTASIIVFTVMSGAGLGLLSLLALGNEVVATPVLSRQGALVAVMAALVMAGIGFASSSLHLARPANAWRSFTRFKTSWLSREAVFAVVTMALGVAYAACLLAAAPDSIRVPLAIALCALCCTVLWCTGMIYASLKPIRQWHTGWTPLCYLLLGHWSGSLILLALAAAFGGRVIALAWLSVLLGIAAAIAKAGYWIAATSDHAVMTLERAIGVREGVRPPGVTVAQARLFDAGHSHGTFLTHEFGFVLARRRATELRWVALELAFAVPLIALIAAPGNPLVSGAAAIACVAGLAIERWLFFAEARHTVRLYHGDART